jgi:hypothetical protein
MKFQQLRYLVAVHENGLNITAAARQLHTSQPGVSRQLKLLEEELGFQLFEREGRALTRTTAAGAPRPNFARPTAGPCRSRRPIPRHAMCCPP